MFPSGKASDPKNEGAKERNVFVRTKPPESKNRGINSNSDKGVKSGNKKGRRNDAEMSKCKNMAEALKEDNIASPLACEGLPGKEKK